MSETRKLAAVVRESGDVEESLASRPPALAHVAVRQPELRLHVGERSQKPSLGLERIRVAGEFRVGRALKGRLNQGLALRTAEEASAGDFPGSPGELVKRQVAIEIAGENFPHLALGRTKPKPADDIRGDNEGRDKRCRADVDDGSLIHVRSPRLRR
jgi:hypothetical protein